MTDGKEEHGKALCRELGDSTGNLIVDDRDVQVWRIVDTETGGCRIEDTFPGIDKSILMPFREFLYPAYIDGNLDLIMATQSFLVRMKDSIFLIEGAVGNGKKRNSWANNLKTDYKDQINRSGFAMSDIKYVIPTHLHMDHVGWFTDENGDIAFPNARYVFIDEEINAYLNHDPRIDGESYAAFSDSVIPVMEAGRADIVPSSHKITDGISFEESFGHSPGHIGIRVVEGGTHLLFCGDIFHHPAQILDPDIIASNYDIDVEGALVSRKKLIDECADTGIQVIGTHFAGVPNVRIKRAAGGTVFEPCDKR